MLHENDYRERVEQFDSLDDMFSKIDSRGWNEACANKSRSSERSDSDSKWTNGVATYEEAVECLKKGFPEALEEMKKHVVEQVGKVEMVGVGSRAKPQAYYAGGSPNVARAIMGVPRDMRRYRREPMKEKTVHIVYCPDCAANVSSARVLEAGAKVLAIVQLLERMNYSVKLSIGTYFKMSSAYAGMETVLKGFRSPLDIGKITFPFAHSAYLRKIGFRWVETTPMLKRGEWDYSYGPAKHALIECARNHHKNENGRLISFYDAEEMNIADWMVSEGFIKEDGKKVA